MVVDLDKGGTFREWVKVYLGPSLGWYPIQVSNVTAITSSGTTTIASGVTLVTVNYNGAVTVQLPSAIAVVGVPITLVGVPMTIVDIGGYAGAHTITILPYGSETIMGLASLPLTTPFGAFTLQPKTITGGWNQI